MGAHTPRERPERLPGQSYVAAATLRASGVRRLAPSAGHGPTPHQEPWLASRADRSCVEVQHTCSFPSWFVSALGDSHSATHSGAPFSPMAGRYPGCVGRGRGKHATLS